MSQLFSESFSRKQRRQIGTGTFFLLVVLAFRIFLFEPCYLSSGSMRPTLEVGDCILVSKSTYRIQIPFLAKPLIQVRSPQRGEIIVFRSPQDPSLYVVKRIVGVPGDVVSYAADRLYINDEPQLQDSVALPKMGALEARIEYLGSVIHPILVDGTPHTWGPLQVPTGAYFVMGVPDRGACGFHLDELGSGSFCFSLGPYRSD
jgi:signal peptidase I